MKQPNVPMNHAITTCRHKVDKEKFDSGWDRIWGKSKVEVIIEDTLEARVKESRRDESHEQWRKAMDFVDGRDE